MCWNLGAGGEPEPFQDQVVDAAIAGSGDVEDTRLGLGGGQHVGEGLERAPRIGGEDQRRIAQRRDRGQIAVHVIGHVLEQGGVDGDLAAGAGHQRIAVGGRARGRRHGDEAVAAGPVLDHHLLAPGIAELGAHKARRDVGYPARRIGHQDPDRPVGIGLRPHGRGTQNSEDGNHADDPEHANPSQCRKMGRRGEPTA